MPGVSFGIHRTLDDGAVPTAKTPGLLCPEAHPNCAERPVCRHLNAIEHSTADDREHHGDDAGDDKAFHE
jgi:hypothetical protein